MTREDGFLKKAPESLRFMIQEEHKLEDDSLNRFFKDSRTLYKTFKQYGYIVITCNSIRLKTQIELLEEFLNSNPGLRSRFNKYIKFEDYAASQLFDIFKQMCEEQDYKIEEPALETVLLKLGRMVANGGTNFANVREVRNYFEQVISKQANRIMGLGGGDVNTLLTITQEDV